MSETSFSYRHLTKRNIAYVGDKTRIALYSVGWIAFGVWFYHKGFGVFWSFLFAVGATSVITEVLIKLINFSSWLMDKSGLYRKLLDRKTKTSVLGLEETLYLLLRSFDADGTASVLDPRAKKGGVKLEYDDIEEMDFEEISEISREPLEIFEALSGMLRNRGHFIAVGDRSLQAKKSNFGLLEVESEIWKPEVLRLMKRAHKIFLIPAPTAGTQWEIDEILAQNMLEKAVFIMLPTYEITVEVSVMADRFSHTTVTEYIKRVPRPKKEKSWRANYDRGVVKLEDAGLETPKHRPDGAMFWYENRKLFTSEIPYDADQMSGLLFNK